MRLATAQLRIQHQLPLNVAELTGCGNSSDPAGTVIHWDQTHCRGNRETQPNSVHASSLAYDFAQLLFRPHFVLTRPIVSAGMIAEQLRITPRAAQDLVAELGLREATGRGSYRAWGIL